MKAADLPDNEEQRLLKLKELDILDTLEEQAYDDLTRLASEICQTPISLVSLVDRDRQWFKSHHGLEARETPRDLAFCSHAILNDELLIVEDSGMDERFHDNPLATGAPHVKFYAGAPLIMSDNLKLGTLCIIDDKPRTLTNEQKQSLTSLARQVVSQLELRLKIKELERLDNAKDEFISMVSHELRTPLTSIIGSLSLLKHNKSWKLDQEPAQMVGLAFRNSERLLGIVNDILDLAKMEAGKLEIQKSPIDVLALLEEAVELNQSYCHQCGCQIILKHGNSKQPVIIEANEQRLLQVMSNLISNAAKYTFNGDTIDIKLDIINSSTRIGVTDHGPGIPKEKQTQLFQKFKQIGINANQKQPGTGLGLNICKQIIELHNGSIGFESISNKSTTFYFTLPLLSQNI